MSDRPFTSDRAKRNADGTVTLTLREPIPVMNDKVSSLTFRKPKAKHFLRMDKGAGSHERNVILIAGMATIPRASAEDLDGLDYLDCEEIVSDFLERSRLIGGASSPKSPGSPDGDSESSES